MKFTRPGDGYRPIQLYHLSAGDVRSETAPPDAALSDWVYFHWVLHIDAPFVDLEVIPDNALDLVVSPSIPDFAALYFPVDRPFSIPLEGPVVYAGSSLRAEQGASILGHDLDSLKQLAPGLDTVNALELGPLVDAVRHGTRLADIRAAMDAFLLSRTGGRKTGAPMKGMLDRLQTHLEPAGIVTVAKALGISERQFRRLSTTILGLSPKKIQRILRLQGALQELFADDGPARYPGFYDDSHLIRELKSLTGLTPGQLRKLAEKYNRHST